MGVYSTLDITRNRAKQYINVILNSELSDEQIHDIMNVLLEPMLYNCRIVPDDTEENDDKCLHF